MSNKASATISNPDGFADLLAKMSEAASESTLRQAAVAGARVILDEVKLRAPVGPFPHIRSGKTYPPGTLKKSVIAYHDAEQSSVTGGYQVYGVVLSSDGFYGRMVEGGHAFSGFVAKVEHGSSRVPAHPFFRPAVDAKAGAAVEAMSDVMRAKLNEAKNV
ncbi:HK97 gp10 family phage protein [Paraburkholderia sp. JPY465]|uniref:HK97-gp10 family putative phage morphogenesis protein n=1 Tax=Paraburkholderia sp. JPY465 TaxID=3042285 RepID=UPI003D217A56